MNNREIEFRIWEERHKKMWDAFNLNKYMSLCESSQDEIQPTGEKNRILLQYTGLKDKNGKKIFEGDIVKHTFQQTVPVNGSFNAPVFFHEGGFAIGTVNNEPLTLREAIKISNKADGLEIIGNVFESPELLSPNPSPI